MKIIEKFKSNQILKNIYWLIIDKLFVLFLQFFIGIKIVNYYGSENYGYYSYAISIFAFFPIIIDLLNARVIKVKISEDESRIITIKKIYSLMSLLSIIIIILLKKYIEAELYYLLIMFSINNLILSNSLGIELFYEYKLKSEKIVYSNMIAKVLILLFQYLCIYYNKSIYYIAISQILGNFFRYLIILYFFKKDFTFEKKKIIDYMLIKEIVKESKYFWIANTANIFFIQMDKIMLGGIIGVKEVAIYTIAIQLIAIIEIPMIPIVNTVFGHLINKFNKGYKEYIEELAKLNTIVTISYIFIALLSSLVVEKSFNLFYNQEYSEAINVYKILAIGSVLKANALFRSSHLTLIKKGKILLTTNLVGMGFAILLNYIFILKYGILGAATATVLSRITITISGVYYKEGKEWFEIQLKSFNLKELRIRR